MINIIIFIFKEFLIKKFASLKNKYNSINFYEPIQTFIELLGHDYNIISIIFIFLYFKIFFMILGW